MESILIDMGISYFITLLRDKIPADSTSKNKYKKVVLKVFKAIAAAYKDDPDFQS